MRNFLNVTKISPGCFKINDVWNKFPCVDEPQYIRSEVKSQKYINELRRTFKKEFGDTLTEYVEEIKHQPIEIGSFIVFNGKLRESGQNISITYMSPNTERMRKLDLIPFKLFGRFINIIPGLSLEKNFIIRS